MNRKWNGLPVSAAMLAGAMFIESAMFGPAHACEFEPADENERHACIERSCGEEETGGARAQCAAGVYQTWAIIEPCETPPYPLGATTQEECVSRAFVANSIAEAVDRANTYQLYLSALGFVDCVRGGDIQACIDPPRLTTPRPPDPYFVSVLRDIDPNARGAFSQYMVGSVEAQYVSRLSTLKEAFAAADETPR